MFHVKQFGSAGRDAALRSERPHAKMFHVKPAQTPESPSVAEVRDALTGIGITATPEQIALLATHASLVLEANRTTNLTRITEREEFLRLHIVDSLLPLTHLPLTEGTVLDIGSGAGFPGIPLAVMGADVALCETRKKKAAYLDQWSQQLGLHIPVLAMRAEEIPGSAGLFDWVIMRAVSSLGALVEIAQPLLREGGSLVAMKGTPSTVEEEEAARVSAIVGMEPAGRIEYALPTVGEQRTLYQYLRKGRSRVPLPRRPGMAQTQPLP